MLRRGLRQAAATAKHICLAEQRAASSTAIASQALHTPAASSSTVLARSQLSGQQLLSLQTRCFSKASDAGAAGSANEAPEAAGEDSEQQAAANEEAVDPKDQLIADKDQQVADYKDKLVRVLADMENLRERTARQAEQSRSFAIQGFVKSLLDVADNLERAAGSVTDLSLKGKSSDGKALTAKQSSKLLQDLMEGVNLTGRILVQALKQNGVEKFTPLGEKFDPNMHSALFQLPDAQKEAGTVVAVTKSGYSLNGRVVRAAEVGVSTQP
ncbi:TPA: Mitochondrial matrix cochaperone [Trebouxia sp. C0004]